MPGFFVSAFLIAEDFMIVLYTDFGAADPYVGQMHAVLAREAPHVPVIDLLHAVPDFDVRAGAYLLASLAPEFPSGTVFIGVVDPGVGGDRQAVMMQAGERWYVGPDNGLFHIVARRAARYEAYVIEWRPERLSASFHGRDLFAPVAAKLARGDWPTAEAGELTSPAGDWPDDWPAVIYIDHYGNAITGLRAARIDLGAALAVAGRQLQHATVFSAVAPGMPFWYENSVGLVEIAVNKGSASQTLDLSLGAEVSILPASH
jgi:hypothetical protein